MDIDDIYLAGKNAAYDIAAKKLLASRKILAWILKYCVEEFKESEIAELHHRDTGSGSDACPSGSDECGEPYPW